MSLLVTTALPETFLEGRHVVFLGEWCKRYSDTRKWSAVAGETLPYHWDIAGKRATDYQHVGDFIQRFMPALVSDVNSCHQCDRPLRYWQIVLGPWLSIYVAALFDRWETIRLALERHPAFETVVLDPSPVFEPPTGWLDLQVRLADDPFNYLLYLSAIRHQCGAGVRFIDVRVEHGTRFQSGPPVQVRPASNRGILRSMRSRLFRALWRMQKHKRIVIAGSHLSLTAFVKLSVLLRQLPRLYPEFTEPIDRRQPETKSALELRDRFMSLCRQRSASTHGFEAFFWDLIGRDFPWSCLEGRQVVEDRALQLDLSCRVAMTAGLHLTNELFKEWAAQQVLTGAALVTVEHGGSLPFDGYFHDVEETMADVHVPTFLPHHAKHTQLPPTKYVGSRPVRRRASRFLTVVMFDGPRYAIRASGQPHASQVIRCFETVSALFKALPDAERAALRVKLSPWNPQHSWDLKERFGDRLGEVHVLPDMSLQQAFRQSRIVVCTYPQSTFAEALLADLPTILCFDPDIHGCHRVADETLRTLREARIVFFDPVLAAAHLGSIWSAPDMWWASPEVRQARAAFMKSTMNLGQRPLHQWAHFLDGLARESGVGPSRLAIGR